MNIEAFCTTLEAHKKAFQTFLDAIVDGDFSVLDQAHGKQGLHYGICWNLSQSMDWENYPGDILLDFHPEDDNTQDLAYWFVTSCSIGWPQHSGNKAWPIPREDSYFSSARWQGEQKLLRQELCAYLLTKLDTYFQELPSKGNFVEC